MTALWKIVWIDSAEEQMAFCRAGEEIQGIIPGCMYRMMDIACGGWQLKARLVGFGNEYEGRFVTDPERSLHEQVVLVGLVYGNERGEGLGACDEVLERYGLGENRS